MGVYSSQDEEDATPRQAAVAGESWNQVADSPIIAAVNSQEALQVALKAPTRTIYLLTGDPLSLPQMVEARMASST